MPYLIKDGENGLIYKDGSLKDLYNKVKFLLDSREQRERLGVNAYKTLTDVWNADIASERLLKLIETIKEGKASPFTDGPCSKG